MQNLLRSALNDAYALLEKRTPTTKTEFVYVCIEDVRPLDLPRFMADNGIPDTADFGGEPNAYDSFDRVCLVYDKEVPTTAKDKMDFRRRTFPTIASKYVFDALTKAGYSRHGCNSGLFKQFDGTTVYGMYKAGDFDQLEKFYSLNFTKSN